MINKGLFTSETGEWETPQVLFNELNEEFGFVLDVCATKENTKCNFYYSKKNNGLNKKWTTQLDLGWKWMNPPYGREITDKAPFSIDNYINFCYTGNK